MKPIRFGVTGSGYMGRTHAEAIKLIGPDQATLSAVWGGSRAGELAQRFSIPCESTLEGLARRQDIDAVVVTTASQQHTADALAAIENGKHVLLEKPMALTVADCDRIIDAAKRNRVFLGLAFNLRFRTNPPKAKELIASGAIGQIQSMHWSMLRRLDDNFGGDKVARWHKSGNPGFYIDGLPHGIDAMRWFTGAEVTQVAAYCRSFLQNPDVEDTDAGILKFSNGSICSFHTTMAGHAPYPGEEARLSIVGSLGMLDIDNFGRMHLSDRAGGWRLVSTQPAVPFADPEQAFVSLGRMQAFIDQIKAFIAGIHGQETRLASGADGRATIAVCEAVMASSRTGRFVSL
jgi:UDP-N-acetyl-2-amino-2-deoxyglucuronate dehydrogenase